MDALGGWGGTRSRHETPSGPVVEERRPRWLRRDEVPSRNPSGPVVEERRPRWLRRDEVPSRNPSGPVVEGGCPRWLRRDGVPSRNRSKKAGQQPPTAMATVGGRGYNR